MSWGSETISQKLADYFGLKDNSLDEFVEFMEYAKLTPEQIDVLYQEQPEATLKYLTENLTPAWLKYIKEKDLQDDWEEFLYEDEVSYVSDEVIKVALENSLSSSTLKLLVEQWFYCIRSLISWHEVLPLLKARPEYPKLLLKLLKKAEQFGSDVEYFQDCFDEGELDDLPMIWKDGLIKPEYQELVLKSCRENPKYQKTLEKLTKKICSDFHNVPTGQKMDLLTPEQRKHYLTVTFPSRYGYLVDEDCYTQVQREMEMLSRYYTPPHYQAPEAIIDDKERQERLRAFRRRCLWKDN